MTSSTDLNPTPIQELRQTASPGYTPPLSERRAVLLKEFNGSEHVVEFLTLTTARRGMVLRHPG